MSCNIHVITTCNEKGWYEYGQKMIDTFNHYWSDSVQLTLYTECFKPDHSVDCKELPDWLYEFKERHKNNPVAHGRDKHTNRRNRTYDYRYDCVRFAHKVAAITDAGLRQNDGLLIWIDADTLTHDTVSVEWIENLFPRGTKRMGHRSEYIAWLSRANKYPECGFLMFRCDHPGHRFFMNRLSDVYKRDGVFTFDETHDSYVIEQIVNEFIRRDVIGPPACLSGPAGRKSSHPFVLSRLGEKMDHLKGNIKKTGKSGKEWVPGRVEKYWS